ncbi:DUF4241 domain-containing protein [Microcoleus sp. F6_B4]
MSYQKFSRLFSENQKIVYQLDEMILTPHCIGELILTSGKLVACDPLVFPGTEPFYASFQPGRYPVTLSIACNPKDNSKIVAYAMLHLSEQTPVNWKLATKIGEDLSALSENEVFGYGVDSGTGCFMDADVGQIIVDKTWESETYEESLTCKLDDLLEEKHSLGFMWANMCVDEATGANVIAFHSGIGDGFYASYFGYDAKGCIANIVTEFLSGELL